MAGNRQWRNQDVVFPQSSPQLICDFFDEGFILWMQAPLQRIAVKKPTIRALTVRRIDPLEVDRQDPENSTRHAILGPSEAREPTTRSSSRYLVQPLRRMRIRPSSGSLRKYCPDLHRVAANKGVGESPA
jgi:hypothetical protein